MSVTVTSHTGRGILPFIEDVARLRIEVFREWPYLYEGDLAYERAYLASFAACPEAVVVAATEGSRVIGVATAAPLVAHTPEFAELFRQSGRDPEAVFYCGESVLLPAWRGKGLGHRFFDAREAHAREFNRLGAAFSSVAFCGVVRDPSDIRRPAGYHDLDAFWMRRGYLKVDGLVGCYRWREIGCPEETEHPMQFWTRAL